MIHNGNPYRTIHHANLDLVELMLVEETGSTNFEKYGVITIPCHAKYNLQGMHAQMPLICKL